MQKTAILYDASQAILSTFDLDEVLKQILSIVRDYFQVNKVGILLLDSHSKEFVLRSQIGGFDEKSLPSNLGVAGQAVRQKRPIYVPDVSKNGHYLANFPETRCELAIPLMVRDEVVGILDIQADRVDYFDSEALDLLTLFSTQASIALENARLYSLEQRRAAQMEAINIIARQTTALLDLDELLGKVCALVLEHFGVDHVVVLIAEDDQLVLRTHKGKLTPCISKGTAIPSGSGLSTKALEGGKTVVENEVTLVRNYVAGFIETRAELCVPLVFYGSKLGVLALESAEPGHFQPEDIQPIEAVADICAAAIQNAHYFEKVQRLAYLDGLTGIYNRRHFEKQIMSELERAERYETHFSVIMVDIDQFKKLNDEFGHILGDEVLRQVSSLFQQQLRKVDVVCRYGGEEFAIIIPQTRGTAAVGTAEKLRRKIETYLFPGVPRRVTISAGVAEYPVNGITRDELVAAADAALYAAKLAGRNRVKAALISEASQGTGA